MDTEKEAAPELEVQKQVANEIMINAKKSATQLFRGEKTLNQIRAEYGLSPLDDESADKYVTLLPKNN